MQSNIVLKKAETDQVDLLLKSASAEITMLTTEKDLLKKKKEDLT